jgi:CMP-N,N'-diacetyllegionaminic acid synthase
MAKQRSQTLGVIPARAGSKSIPGKNLAMVGGQPLIVYSISVALQVSALDRILVSTDSKRIASVARKSGAEVPFLRPADLARDDTPGALPALHALDWLAEHEGYHADWVMLLQPTSPLRSVKDIEAAIELARRPDVDSVVSVSQGRQHPYWAKTISPDGYLESFFDTDRETAPRQALPPVCFPNGAIYLTRSAALRAHGSFLTERTAAHLMPVERALDIDLPWDLKMADSLLSERSQ